MKLAAVKKEYEKFRDNISENIQTVFASIPEGLDISSQSKSRIQLKNRS